jgi:hypothetical protein
MSINFPEYADLGMTATPQTLHDWDAEIMRLERFWYYYSGEALKEQIDTEVQIGTEVPLVFPVGLNLTKMLCLAQADTIFGEWEDQPVRFGVKLSDEIEDPDREAGKLLEAILEISNGATMLWECALDREIFGGCAFKVEPAAQYPHIKWTRIPREAFFPIWNPNDIDDLLEVYIKIAMSPDQAKALYNYDTTKDIVYRVEHWTKHRYENYLDGKRLSDKSGTNPWGIVPFVYIPRLRSASWFGDALTEDIIPAQDELNMRVADIGDAINYNAHPTRWGLNLPRDFNADNYPLGPNAFWNIGRTIGSSPPPEVGVLEVKEAVQEGVFKHLEFVYDWVRFSSFMPPIAFGQDQGSQRSGDSLEIRMWPLLKLARRSRSYLANGLKRAAKISAAILRQKQWKDVPIRPINHILEGRIVPQFHDILPRDQQRAVDEVVKLSSTTPRHISSHTAQQILGRSTTETDRIEEDNANSKLFINPIDKQELKNASKQAENAAKVKQPAGTGDTKKAEGDK